MRDARTFSPLIAARIAVRREAIESAARSSIVFPSAMLRCRYARLITIDFTSAFESQPLWMNLAESQSSTAG